MGRKLPEGWEFKDFEDIVEILDSKRKPINSSERNQRIGNIPYYGATGQAGTIDDYIFDEELVLLGEDGADFINKDKDVAYLISGKSWVNNHAHVLKGKNGLSNKWLCYFLNSIDYSNRVAGATRMKLNQAEMKKIKILFSPTEQQKIVSYLDKQFKFIDNMEEQINDYNNKLDKLEKGILEEAFSSFSENEYIKIGDKLKTSSGGTPNRSNKNFYENGNIPWLKSGEVAQGLIYDSEEKITKNALENSSAKIFPINTVLLAMYGATAGQVGILKIEASTNQAVCGIFPDENIEPKYLYYYLRAKKDYIISLSGGGAQPNISQTIIKDLTFPFIKIETQKSIAYKLDKQFELINSTRQEIIKQQENLKELRKAMLNDIFGGFEE